MGAILIAKCLSNDLEKYHDSTGHLSTKWNIERAWGGGREREEEERKRDMKGKSRKKEAERRLCIKGNKKEIDKPFGIANFCVADRVKESQSIRQRIFFPPEKKETAHCSC